MCKAPAFVFGDQPSAYVNGFDLVFNGRKVTTIVGDKKYVIGVCDDSRLFIRIEYFDTWGKWVCIYPRVLGTQPILTSQICARPLGEGRVLVIEKDATTYDNVWILEVDTPYVREQKKLLAIDDVVAWSKGVVEYVEKPKPIVISGPSGVGKGTLISKLMKEFPSMFGFSVSHTTCAPREKEINGIHYHVAEISVMEEEIKDGKFLEFARVHGNLYGTSIESVQVGADEGKRCILDIDVQGAKAVRNSALDAIFIFICPPSYEDLEKRLRFRGTETEEQLQKRLRNAKVELEQGRSPGLFDHVLVNDDLEACYKTLKILLGLYELDDITNQSVPNKVGFSSSELNQK